MSISTYAELSTAMENWLHRSGLTNRIPEFITIGEARIGREVRARAMEQRVSSTPTSNIEVLPTDFVAMRAIRIKAGTIGWLEYMTPDEFFNTTPSSSGSSLKKYTIIGSELVFPKQPSGDLEIWYFKKLAALSSSLNTLFTNNPDLYLYAAMAAAQPFLQKDAKIPLWDSLYTQTKDSVNTSDRQGRYPQGGLAVRVA